MRSKVQLGRFVKPWTELFPRRDPQKTMSMKLYTVYLLPSDRQAIIAGKIHHQDSALSTTSRLELLMVRPCLKSFKSRSEF